jgi:transposase IS116/IS110/IS902 family protein
MAAIPTPEGEDARRPNREREGLVGERTRTINRMKGCLARLGIRGFGPASRGVPERLEALRTPEGVGLPPNTPSELRRDVARLRFASDQIAEIEAARPAGLEQGPHAMVRLLARVVGAGIETADMLVHEVPSRELRERRAVARYAGLTGSPEESGASRREKGAGQGGQRARAPRHGPARLALPPLPGGQRPGALVPGADRGCPRRHAQGHDRCPGEEAPDRLVAPRDHRRGVGGRRPTPGGVRARPKTISRSAHASRRAADDDPRWR